MKTSRQYKAIACAVILALALMARAVIVYAWAGTDIQAELTFPDFSVASQNVALPFTVTGKFYNPSLPNDFYEMWLIEDANDNTIIDAAEYAARIVFWHQEDYNVDGTGKRLTPRNYGSVMFLEGSSYFMIIYGEDLNGDPNMLVADITGAGTAGNGTLGEELISYFTTVGRRP